MRALSKLRVQKCACIVCIFFLSKDSSSHMYSPYNKSSRSPHPKGPRSNEKAPLNNHLQIPAFGSIGQQSTEPDVTETEDEVWTVVKPVVMSQFLERTAFYGLQASMVLYLTKYLSMKSGDADGQCHFISYFTL